MTINKDELLAYMRADLGVDTSEISDSTPLFSSGILDSFSLVSLLTHLESKCRFRIDPSDLNLENMDSLERIMAYIGRVSA